MAYLYILYRNLYKQCFTYIFMCVCIYSPLEKEKAIHFSILAWQIPWTEEPGGQQYMGSQRVVYNLVTKQQQQHTNCCSSVDFLKSKKVIKSMTSTSHSSVQFSSVQLLSLVRLFLRPHELQHARPPCPSPTPGVEPDSGPSSQWCHPAISSSVVPFSSCPQSLPASESFPRSQLFTWGGQSIGVSALASFLPKKSQGWSPLISIIKMIALELLILLMNNDIVINLIPLVNPFLISPLWHDKLFSNSH